MSHPPQFCPICAHPLAARETGGRLRPACDNCGYVHYVNPVPGVGIVIELDGGIVLVRRGHPPHKGEWALPSGFIEADESAEEAAVREAYEETGLEIEILELAGVNSFPEGPPTSGIMIFFRAKPVGGVLCAGDDAAEARVFPPAEVPRMPFRTHREMMAKWLQTRGGMMLQPIPQASASEIHDSARKPAFIIRPAESRDADEVLALLAMIPANRALANSEWAQITQRFQESPGLEVFVAQTCEQPEILIGFITLSIVRTLTGGQGFINDMAVLPSYQRQGVGAQLLEAVLRRANRLNLRALVVNTERGNDQARAFYAALGFSETPLMRLKIR